MQEQQDRPLPSLMSSLSAKANDLVLEISWLRAQNTGFRTENSILRKQQDELLARVSALESEVIQHKATEAELTQSIRRISDTLSSVDVSSGTKQAAENTITFGPSTGQTTYFNHSSSEKSASRRAFTNSKAVHPASSGGKACVPSSPFANATFAGKAGTSSPPVLFESSFGAPKIGDEKSDSNPFKTTTARKECDSFKSKYRKAELGASTTTTNQQMFSLSPEKSAPQKFPESTSVASKPSLFSSTSDKRNTEKDAAKTSEYTRPSNRPGLFSSSCDKTDSNSLAQTTSNPDGPRGLTTAAGTPFKAWTSGSLFPAKFEPPAETKDTNKSFSPFGAKAQDNASEALRTAPDPMQTNGSSAPNGNEGCNIHNAHKDKVSEDQKWQDYSKLFPLPTPLSRSTFESASTSKTQELETDEARSGSEDRRPASLIPPPRSTSFSHQISREDGEKYVTISLMPFFKSYSTEEVRLWDYVNGEKFKAF